MTNAFPVGRFSVVSEIADSNAARSDGSKSSSNRFTAHAGPFRRGAIAANAVASFDIRSTSNCATGYAPLP
jgi:hypothetical protein